MVIAKVLSRDIHHLWVLYACRCGHTHIGAAHNDDTFRSKAVPTLNCRVCGKTELDYNTTPQGGSMPTPYQQIVVYETVTPLGKRAIVYYEPNYSGECKYKIQIFGGKDNTEMLEVLRATKEQYAIKIARSILRQPYLRNEINPF